MNFIFISPNFPKTYWHFCEALKKKGINTLAIGEDSYDSLNEDLKSSLNEYYKVTNLKDYDEVYRACAYLAFKHGKIDWIESNNEFWLEQDAKLRTDFNINTGIKTDRIDSIKYKSKMKAFYEKAGIPVARYQIATSFEKSIEFANHVGYPLIAKPDNGVGASATYKIKNEDELKQFYQQELKTTFIIEEFIDGTLLSYDGIAGHNKEIIFETAHIYPDPIMELVNQQKDVWFYSYQEIPQDLKEIGRKAIQSFDSNSRFFHTEYFRLKETKEGLAQKGELVGLEVNMRPPGGYICDMIDFAHEINIYQIWANMIKDNEGDYHSVAKAHVCVYAARRDIHIYVHTMKAILEKYQTNIKMIERMPSVFAQAMGDDALMAIFESEEEACDFATYVLKQK